jgi:hypothetical protein
MFLHYRLEITEDDGLEKCAYQRFLGIRVFLSRYYAQGIFIISPSSICIGAIAKFETEILAERQMDGIQKAKEKGVKFGRKKKLTQQHKGEIRKRRP